MPKCHCAATCHSASAYQISSKSDHPRRSYNVISIPGIAILLPVSIFVISLVISLIWEGRSLPALISQSTAETLLLPVSENKRPPCWNFTSGSDFYVCVTIGMSFCTCLPNFVQIGSSKMTSYPFFKMAARTSQFCFPVSVFVISLMWEGRSLPAYQISATYLNSRLRYYYFWFLKTNVRHVGILLPVPVFTARRYASAVLAVIVFPSVCPSVRPSVTSRSCAKMAKPRIRLTTPYDSPETLVLRCQKFWRNSHDIAPNGGAKQRWGRFLARFAANISLYLRNGAR